jgi:hypothetical protein
VIAAVSVPLRAAEPPQPKPVPRPIQAFDPVIFQPAGVQTTRRPTLADLVLAKVDRNEDGPRVILMIESSRKETRKVKVTRIVQEKRERQVVVDGKTVPQQFTVSVPVIEEMEMEVDVPAGRKPATMAADDFRFFSLDAAEVSVDDACQHLSSLHPVFLIDQYNGDPTPLPDIARRAMKENCLLLVTEKKVRSVPVPADNFRAIRPLPPVPALPVLPAQPALPAQP